MKNDKIGILSNVLKIYETRTYQKIQEIAIENEIIEKILELDNKDLIIASKANAPASTKKNYLIKIYRLKNGKYELFQTIYDDENGFKIKIKTVSISYELENVIQLSRNKFITFSPLGFKIYSLSNADDSNSKYSLYFMFKNESHDFIYDIYPINENELIIIYYEFNYSLLGFNYFDIEKFDIKKNKMIKKIYHKGKYSKGDPITFSNYIVIKNKYLVIVVNKKIYIFDIIKGEKNLVFTTILKCDCYYNGLVYNLESTNDDIFLLVQDELLVFIQYDELRNKANITGYFECDIQSRINAVFYLDYKTNKEIKKFKNKNVFYNYRDEFINFY